MAAEVIAPTTATFAAGNTVIGFGTTLPAELAAWVPFATDPTIKPVTATVFYNAQWSAAATVPTVKFTFMTTVITPSDGGVHTFWGYGLVANPSVSTTAVIMCGVNPSYLPNGYGAGQAGVAHRFYSKNNTELVAIAQDDAGGDGAVAVYDIAGTQRINLGCNYYDPAVYPSLTGFLITFDNTGAVTGSAPPGLI